VWQAMTELGSEDIAVVVVTGRSDPEIKALRLALNRLPFDARWDNERVREELRELVDLSFDLELTGFDRIEIDNLLEIDVPKVALTEERDCIPQKNGPAVTALGDIWACGRHRIGCGDARDQSFVEKVAASSRPRMCFIDPGHGTGTEAPDSRQRCNQGREFVPAIPERRFGGSLPSCLNVLRRSSAEGALIYVCMDWRQVHELLNAGRQSNLELLSLCVWAKQNAQTGILYRSQHELICVFRAGATDLARDIAGGPRGRRNRTDLWSYQDTPALGIARDQFQPSPAAGKPIAMIADAIRDVTRRGDAVLDTFLGAGGSTLLAAEETGRVCFGVELNPLQVDAAVRCCQHKTGRDAIHVDTGELFEERCRRSTAQSERLHNG
jgi:hypothetical protein